MRAAGLDSTEHLNLRSSSDTGIDSQKTKIIRIFYYQVEDKNYDEIQHNFPDKLRVKSMGPIQIDMFQN